MKLIRNKIVLIGLVFALYSGVLIYYFNPFQLVTNESTLISLLFTSLLIFVLFVGINSISKLFDSSVLKKGLFIASFMVVPICAGLIFYSIFANNESDYLLIYLSSFFVLSLLPASVALLYTIFAEIQGKIIVSSESNEIENEGQNLILQNDKGKILLSVKLKVIICFEANDNYVVTYHLSSLGKVEKSMERISLKKIDELLNNLGANFQRVHKSYIVNPNYVIKVLGKAQNHQLKIANMEKFVPVSRNFDVSFFQENHY